ncbi:ABC transporter substrate-binding protein [Christensenellaceae bacterium OttesenSCG-928-M15]|nr:ABC transporter substrate-binding protein [Christensenellaceae bacterium OttesenSCG-928-M15]
MLKSSRKKHISVLVAIALLLCMMLAACSSSTPDAAPDATAPAQSPSATQQGTAGDNQGTDAPAAQQILRVARDFEGSSLDPAMHTTNTDFMFGPNVFETLVRYDENFVTIPWLAETFDQSADRLTYTFNIRKGVQFHYGYGELTAQDVKYSFERLADPDAAAASNAVDIGLENMESIEAPDTYTLIIKLKQEDPNFLVKMATYPSNIISQKAVEEMGLAKFATLPIGTGAFMVEEGAVMGESCAVVRFDEYWGEKATLDKITFQLITEPGTMYNAFESGEVDMIQISDYDKLEQYRAQSETYHIYTGLSRSLLYVGNNMSEGPFKDARVREAFVCAIDRDSIVNSYFRGLANPAKGLVPAPTKFALNDYWNPQYNPERAKELLAEAGYPNGFDTEFYCPNDAISMGPATVIQNQLAQVGINAQLYTVDFGVYLDKVRTGAAPIWLLYNDTNIIPDNTLSRYTSQYYPGSNWCGIQDAAYDAAVEAALAETDESKREALYHDVQRKLIDFNAVYAVSDSEQYNITAAKVKNMTFRPDLGINYEKITIE